MLRFTTAVACALALLLLGACERREAPVAPAPAPAPVERPSTEAPIRQMFTVATDASYAPFEVLNERGEIVGFDIDLLTAVAGKAGFDVRFVNTPWSALPEAVARGEADVLISAMAITAEREKLLSFSRPYFEAQQLMVVRSDSRATRFTDLKSLAVGVQAGTVGDAAVAGLSGPAAVRVQRFDTALLAMQALRAGNVEAVVSDSGPVLHDLAHRGGALRWATVPDFAPTRYGFAVKKGRTDLLDALDRGLREVQADGTYEKIYAAYFLVGPRQTVETPSTTVLSPASQQR